MKKALDPAIKDCVHERVCETFDNFLDQCVFVLNGVFFENYCFFAFRGGDWRDVKMSSFFALYLAGKEQKILRKRISFLSFLH